MGRPIYQHELGDPDFNWLISRFLEKNPEYHVLESGTAPILLIKSDRPVALDYAPPPEENEPSVLGEDQE